MISRGNTPVAACPDNLRSDDSPAAEAARTGPAVNPKEEKPQYESSRAGDPRPVATALEEGFDLANTVIQAAEDAIICLTLDGMTLSWNPAAERIYGYTAAEANNRSFSLVVSPEDWPELLRDLIAMAAGAHAVPRQITCVHREGSVIAVSIAISPLRLSPGHLAGAAVIARQMDLLPGQEHELRDANKQLSETVRNLEQRNREMNFVQQLSTLLQSCLTATEAHMVLDQSLPKLFPSGTLFEWNTSVNLLEAKVKWGQPPLNDPVFSPEECWALRSGRVHRVADPSTLLLCPHLSRLSSSNSICAPLVASGETLGVLTVQGGP